MTRAAIIGTGFFVPENVVTNDDLAGMMDTSDQWITERSGIKERRWLPRDENGITTMSGSEMGAEAARQAPGALTGLARGLRRWIEQQPGVRHDHAQA